MPSSSLLVRDLHVSFGPVEVLRGVDLEVPRGTTTCVIGPSGSGKSTLLRAINQLEPPSRGEVLLDGSGVADVNVLRRRIGMVFQHFNLFAHRTVLDNLVLPLRSVLRLSQEEARDRASRYLDRVGLADKAPFRPSALSGGQRQRVAIARALAMEPEVVLFDEATSALDPELVKGVLGLMAELSSAGMTMVVVTHEMGFAREVADQVCFLDHGLVVESGPPAAVFGSPTAPRLRKFLDQVL
ncbi:amino acid ABC transporter ATP-binding protein [Actinokineospora inagensis]|uniref:amino acid ABC transporter ATP-binding protein n=1 Tax=Actinokineospora inagensis TaxID=103730 RepID=UPI00040BD3C9|nr:amino acid ABC transporter ATP-binding protein [Actinokineospora inagensis]